MSLSDRIKDDDDREQCILETKDVKEFIKQIKKEIKETIIANNGVMPENFEWIEKDIDKLAGDKLI